MGEFLIPAAGAGRAHHLKSTSCSSRPGGRFSLFFRVQCPLGHTTYALPRSPPHSQTPMSQSRARHQCRSDTRSARRELTHVGDLNILNSTGNTNHSWPLSSPKGSRHTSTAIPRALHAGFPLPLPLPGNFFAAAASSAATFPYWQLRVHLFNAFLRSDRFCRCSSTAARLLSRRRRRGTEAAGPVRYHGQLVHQILLQFLAGRK